MPGMIELRLDTDHPENVKNVLIEQKIDGSRHEWTGSQLLSERNIDRADRFPHIVRELKQMPWKVRGEIAIPYGHVLDVSKAQNWPRARFYIFDMFEWEGQDARNANAADNRKLIEDAFGNAPKFNSLRYPFKWKDFQTGWAFTVKHQLEGLVLKELNGTGRQFKVKMYHEVKVPIIGLEVGAVKGAFLVLLNGVTCKVSALSADNVAKYHAMLKANEEPYAEVEYLFLTESSIMFQPRLRRLGTRKDILLG